MFKKVDWKAKVTAFKSFTGLLTVLFELENVLNNSPSCFVYGDDTSDILTPNCLLHRKNLDRENKIVE